MWTFQNIDEANREYWDREIQQLEHAHPFNTYGWSVVRGIDGWLFSHILALKDGTVVGAVNLLRKRIPFCGMSIMYSPRGFLCDPYDTETLHAMLEKIREEAKESRAVFCRIDPNIPEDDISENSDPFEEAGFEHLTRRWTYWNAPRDVYRVDLRKGGDEEELFELIDPKARTGVRKARKEGVIIRPAENLSEVRGFYDVYKKFAVDKGFLLRGFDYQQRLWDEFISRKKGILTLSIYDGEIIGGQICLISGPMCVEMHRGVSYKYHRLRVNEALVWDGICWAKANGCEWYCQRGAGSPSLQQFKKKFNSQLISLAGYYDLPFYPMIYRIWVFFEFNILPSAVRCLMVARRALGEGLLSILKRRQSRAKRKESEN